MRKGKWLFLLLHHDLRTVFRVVFVLGSFVERRDLADCISHLLQSRFAFDAFSVLPQRRSRVDRQPSTGFDHFARLGILLRLDSVVLRSYLINKNEELTQR